MQRKLAVRINEAIEEAKAFGIASKKEIAGKIGITPTHLSNLLSGRNQWNPDQLDKLEAIGIKIVVMDANSCAEWQCTDPNHMRLHLLLERILHGDAQKGGWISGNIYTFHQSLDVPPSGDSTTKRNNFTSESGIHPGETPAFVNPAHKSLKKRRRK